ncbi:hypothetical protein LBMAG53_35890 [Planctomycetota bacterium]|nr:hypothetical protein LBMAG53_35890 [Planctomycetota bacterium]
MNPATNPEHASSQHASSELANSELANSERRSLSGRATSDVISWNIPFPLSGHPWPAGRTESGAPGGSTTSGWATTGDVIPRNHSERRTPSGRTASDVISWNIPIPLSGHPWPAGRTESGAPGGWTPC